MQAVFIISRKIFLAEKQNTFKTFQLKFESNVILQKNACYLMPLKNMFLFSDWIKW